MPICIPCSSITSPSADLVQRYTSLFGDEYLAKTALQHLQRLNRLSVSYPVDKSKVVHVIANSTINRLIETGHSIVLVDELDMIYSDNFDGPGSASSLCFIAVVKFIENKRGTTERLTDFARCSIGVVLGYNPQVGRRRADIACVALQMLYTETIMLRPFCTIETAVPCVDGPCADGFQQWVENLMQNKTCGRISGCMAITITAKAGAACTCLRSSTLPLPTPLDLPRRIAAAQSQPAIAAARDQLERIYKTVSLLPKASVMTYLCAGAEPVRRFAVEAQMQTMTIFTPFPRKLIFLIGNYLGNW